ncbi:hypothetical protein Ddc_19750 [Ditylenchus destructor]|nr:hypothetical protein Ddc_19750 [Ditylenchus destructor]
MGKQALQQSQRVLRIAGHHVLQQGEGLGRGFGAAQTLVARVVADVLAAAAQVGAEQLALLAFQLERQRGEQQHMAALQAGGGFLLHGCGEGAGPAVDGQGDDVREDGSGGGSRGGARGRQGLGRGSFCLDHADTIAAYNIAPCKESVKGQLTEEGSSHVRASGGPP